MFRQRSANVHSFAMVPRADVPRSAFRMQETYKTTFDAGYLIPFACKEVVPGDTFNLKATFFARLATPLFPFMDNLWFETFWFFCPLRLVWTNFPKFMGEQANPGDSISFTIPQIVASPGGYSANSIYDYFGLPTAGQIAGANTYSHSALPLRIYNKIYNEWFRDENLQLLPWLVQYERARATQRSVGAGTLETMNALEREWFQFLERLAVRVRDSINSAGSGARAFDDLDNVHVPNWRTR